MVRTRSYFTVLTMLATMVLLCVLASSSGAAAGVTSRVSVADSSGIQANGGSTPVSISADGRYVTFASLATNLVPNDTNATYDVFVRDRQTGTTERVSVNSSETQASGSTTTENEHERWGRPSISADGRYVAFLSSATNLVANDTNGRRDIFVRDRQEGTTERVSVDSSEFQANLESNSPSISAGGRYVAFSSHAWNLVANDTNGFEDVFVRDRQTGTTERMSVDSSGAQTTSGGFSSRPSISSDGRFVAFSSAGKDLVANDTNNAVDIFVRDRQTGTIERASVNSSETQADGGSMISPMSTDGRYVAFTSAATNLVANDTNGSSDIFVRDRQEGTTERVSVDSSEAQANGGTDFPSISSDGHFVAFSTDTVDGATNLVPNDTNNAYDVFMRDQLTGTTERVSVNTCGVQANSFSVRPSISSDGRFVAFVSGANNLVADDTNNSTDVFVRERDATQMSDCIAPTATVSAITDSDPDYTSGTWTSEDVTVTLSAQDNESGSGVKQLTYSATGAQPIASTSVLANELPKQLPIINTEGTTTISYFATDNAGNIETQKTFTVRLDKSAPTLDTDNSDGADGVTPDKGQTGVRRNVNPAATFSDQMDPASLGTSARLDQWNAQQGRWQRVSARVSVADKTGTLDPYPSDPSRLLAANKRFKVTVTTGAKNLAGLSMASPKSWIFTTGTR